MKDKGRATGGGQVADLSLFSLLLPHPIACDRWSSQWYINKSDISCHYLISARLPGSALKGRGH